ncbi:popeye domain-containing protein 3-like [Mizuhopecten yessoensis]|uniref:Blood vessel epicardial substance n=1 Tax=Mizuhopecten yessoensis TaxID=6573 RepID=A0A210QUW8_MIZYE|nr:popeye domain-containing protein 3-like [Mizuhopecten yessoensis]OWF52517.1 Blood vessel epicardial substance [Mizuhopecten yessoensis]
MVVLELADSLTEEMFSYDSERNTTKSNLLIFDAILPNASVFLGNITETVIGCFSWSSSNHFLFQVANVVILIGLCSPDRKNGVLFMHSSFVLGFLLLSIWSWVILCAPDFFSWNFAFMVINAFQALFIMYNIRPVKFCVELEEIYVRLFQPLKIPRSLFKKLTCADFCTLTTLHEGEAYCSQAISKTDRLGLLISGRMNVYHHHNILHQIQEMEFIDSPEFESGVSGDEKYQVSIYAVATCRYIFWPRQSLEYLLIKEPYLANVINAMLGRDITTKLYALNEKVTSPKGARMDIRLPTVSSTIKAKPDLRKTVVGMIEDLSQNEARHNGSRSPGNTKDVAEINNLTRPNIEEEEEEDPYLDDSVEENEKTELLNGHVRPPLFGGPSLSTCSETPSGSHGSVNSGLHFNI